jgi:glycosyltransferase involved in cell wall biosynthesis
MKVAYDHQIFSRANYGGISKYFVQLLKHLDRYDDFSYELLSRFSNNEDLAELGVNDIDPFFKARNFRGKAKMLTFFNDFYSSRRMKTRSFDLLHPTYYSTYFLRHFPKSKPFVVTCYDLIHEKLGDKFAPLKKDNPAGKKEILERSNQIIAISHTTKDDIISYYGIEPRKITVIHLGHSQNISPSSEATALPQHYLLFVGVRSLYKNFNFFIESMETVLKTFPDINIVCAGGGEFSPGELQLFDKMNISHRVTYHEINNKNLSAIYSRAIAFFYPSLYEGFGIPVLEAFSNNCPTVLSNTGSLPEVAQDAAIYFDPYDKDSLIEAAYKVVENREQRELLKKKGLNRLAHFSWETTAAQTYEVYKSLI